MGIGGDLNSADDEGWLEGGFGKVGKTPPGLPAPYQTPLSPAEKLERAAAVRESVKAKLAAAKAGEAGTDGVAAGKDSGGVSSG